LVDDVLSVSESDLAVVSCRVRVRAAEVLGLFGRLQVPAVLQALSKNPLEGQPDQQVGAS
jgi:hypothetical protein